MFMREIETVADALEWFESDDPTKDDPPKDDSSYRTPVSGKESLADCGFEGSYYEQNNRPQKYEPDSSPKAWKHFLRFYSDFLSTLHSKETTFRYYSKTSNNNHYTSPVLCLDSGYRLVAVPEGYTTIRKQDTLINVSRVERLGGDCDFNFNKDKCPRFVRYLLGLSSEGEVDLDEFFKQFKQAENDQAENEQAENEQEKNGIRKLLYYCHKMHHTLLNFSLMQCSGAMQLVKQNLDRDRVDRLIFFINRFYIFNDSKVLSRATNDAYKADLMHYLVSIVDNILPTNKIYQYCAKIYFLPTHGFPTGKMMEKDSAFQQLDDDSKYKWDTLLTRNKHLIDDLIASGEKFMDTYERVKEYMLLAVRFWQAKETYFTLMDAILKDAKKNE